MKILENALKTKSISNKNKLNKDANQIRSSVEQLLKMMNDTCANDKNLPAAKLSLYTEALLYINTILLNAEQV